MPERYLANLIWSWAQVMGDFEGDFKRYVGLCKEAGVDTIRMDVQWKMMEPQRGRFDFEWADRRLRFLAREMGMNLVIILNSRDYPDWLGGERFLMRWADGEAFLKNMGTRKYGILSFHAPEVREATAAFYGAAVRHFESEFGDKVLAYSSAWTPEMESEYYHGTRQSGKPDESGPRRNEYLDYSEFARKEFKEWLAERNLDEDEIPLPSDDDERFARWLAFRDWALGRMFKRLSEAVSKAGAKGKYKVQFGSVWDVMSGRRATLGFGYSTEAADWVVVDDAVDYDHCFSADVLWGTVPGKMKANEEGGGPVLMEVIQQFARETYEHGVNMFQFANRCGRESMKWFEENRKALREIARLRDEAELLPEADGEMVVSARELYLARCDQRKVEALIRRYHAGSEGGKKRWPVRFEYDLPK